MISLLLVCYAVSCGHRSSDPERALENYVHAVNDGRCADARKLLSSRTIRALDYLHVKPQHPQNPLPVEQYYCNDLIFEDCKWNKMELTQKYADKATVSMPCGRTQDSFLPGFSSPFLKYEPRENELVREDGEWRIVLPFVIRMIEVREKEDQLREEALRQQRLRQRSRDPFRQ
jgi:hypothetical protein